MYMYRTFVRMISYSCGSLSCGEDLVDLCHGVHVPDSQTAVLRDGG